MGLRSKILHITESILSAYMKTPSGYQSVYRKIEKYDIISFDIFDTLLYRIDNYDCLITLNTYNLDAILAGYKMMRRNAQKEAEKDGKYKLPEIYTYLEKLYGVSREKSLELMEAEIKNEILRCYPNKTLLAIMNRAKNLNKRIILISDMYYTKSQLEEILKEKKITDYDYLYVSCEYEATKSSGKLFEIVKRDKANQGSMLHIGDSLIGDYVRPSRMGHTDSVLLPRIILNTYENWNRYSFSLLSSEEYSFGYQFLGPVIWDFCKWIDESADAEKLDALIFLTREGAFFQQIYKKAVDSIRPANIMFSSRRAVLKYTSDYNWDYLLSVFKGIRCTLNDVCDMFDISIRLKNDICVKQNINGNEELITLSCADDVLEDLRETIQEYSKKNRQIFIDYIKQIIELEDESKHYKVGLVDIGWSGTTQVMLSNMLRDEIPNVDICGLYFAVLNEKKPQYRKIGYLCSPNNRKNENMVANAGFLFENLFSTQINQTIAYKYEGKKVMPVFMVNSTCKSSIVKNVQKGILDYASNMKIYGWKINKTEGLEPLLKILSMPSLKFSELLGDISWHDQNSIQYIAKPDSLYKYLTNKSNLVRDLNRCGWKSAFCKRLFKLPINYFRIYSIFKSKTRK